MDFLKYYLFLVFALSQVALASTSVDEVVIWSSPSHLPAGAAIQVLQKEDIENTLHENLQDLLAEVIGLQVLQSGGPGQQSSVTIRGARSEQTLVLIDGVPVNDPLNPSRSYDFAHMSTHNIERIEVYRGPHSVWFGSGAIGGVIQIISKKGTGPAKLQAAVEAGSFGTAALSTNHSGSHKDWKHSLGLSYLKTDGISAAAAGPSAEKDGSEQWTISGRWDRQWSSKYKLKLIGRLNSTDTEIDRGGGPSNDDPNYESKYQEALISAQLNTQHSQKYNSLFQIYTSESLRELDNSVDTSSSSTADSKFDSQAYGIKAQQLYQNSPRHKFRFDADYRSEKAKSREDYSGSSSNFPRRELSLSGVALSSIYESEDYFYELAARANQNTGRDAEPNFRLVLGKDFGTYLPTLQFSWGTAYKTPSLYQLYSPQFGNPSLRGESAESFEVSYTQKLNKKWRLFTALFITDYKQLIEFDTVSSDYFNLEEASSRGFEAGINATLTKNLGVELEWTYLRAFDETADLQLLRRPRQSAQLKAFYQKNNWRIEGALHHTGRRPDTDPATSARLEMPSYSVINLRGSYRLNPKWTWTAQAQNILDKDYQAVSGYETRGLSFYTGFKYQ